MKLNSKFKGLSTVLMGLAIPLHVVAIKPPCTIEFEAVTAKEQRVPLVMTLTSTATANDLSMMYLLAPALAVFLRGNGVKNIDDADDLASLKDVPRAPVLPDPMLAALNATPGTTIGETLVSARRAMKDAVSRVPSLAHISLSGLTLEEWLGIYVLDIESTASKGEQILEELNKQERLQEEFEREFKRKSAELLEEHKRGFTKIARLLKESRSDLLLLLARGS